MPGKYTVVNNYRLLNTQQQAEANDERMDRGITTHVSPGSTLIAAMGDHWKPQCFEAVKQMAYHTWEAGCEVCFYEEPDRCYNPFDAIGSMRNMAYWRAIREGWEYLLYVDNDVMPPPDALEKLLARRLPIIAPILRYLNDEDHGISQARMEFGNGLVMVGSCLLSFLLIRTSVFLPWATSPFWGNEIGDDEAYHFAKLDMIGHRPFIDTNVVVEVKSPPHFPLDERLTGGVNGDKAGEAGQAPQGADVPAGEADADTKAQQVPRLWTPS